MNGKLKGSEQTERISVLSISAADVTFSQFLRLHLLRLDQQMPVLLDYYEYATV